MWGDGRAMVDIEIREITPHDAALAARLVAALLRELSPCYTPDVSAMEAAASRLLSAGSVTGLAAFRDGDAVGLLMLNDCAAIYAGGRFGEITELYVAPPFRSRGVAVQLLDAAIAVGKARDWKRIEVGAPDQPAWARTKAFYEREGFVEVGPRLKRVF